MKNSPLFTTKKYVLFIITLATFSLLHGEPRIRPLEWGQPVIGSKLKNWHKLDEKLYRSAQPDDDEFKQIQKFGIKNILNMRNYHNDKDEAEGTGLKLYHIPIDAGKISEQEIEKALAIIRDAEGPVLVHCWHGSDRTGAICAAYRIVFQNWTTDSAIDELKNGGYGFHSIYKGIPKTIKEIDWNGMKKRLKKVQKTK